MASITYDHVWKRFGDVVAVQDLDIFIEDEEFLVFVGPSGCGKSTSLRLLACLEEISEGEILIGDRLVNDVPPKDRDIAMVFQNYALYPHMTVYKNMAFGLKLRKFPKNEIEQRVQDAAEILGIGELLHRRPKELSGGQRQRVTIARALVTNPAIVWADEPTGDLDSKTAQEVMNLMRRLNRENNQTFVIVTHSAEIGEQSDRIITMRDGLCDSYDGTFGRNGREMGSVRREESDEGDLWPAS